LKRTRKEKLDLIRSQISERRRLAYVSYQGKKRMFSGISRRSLSTGDRQGESLAHRKRMFFQEGDLTGRDIRRGEKKKGFAAAGAEASERAGLSTFPQKKNDWGRGGQKEVRGGKISTRPREKRGLWQFEGKNYFNGTHRGDVVRTYRARCSRARLKKGGGVGRVTNENLLGKGPKHWKEATTAE